MDQLTLRLPTEDEEPEFLRAHRATSPEVPYFLHYYSEGMRLRDYLERLAGQRHGTNLPPNHVPATFLFAFVGPRIAGRVSIRHALNEALEKVGGHIGYVVVPEFRRRGYATEILRQALHIAREHLGIDRVLVTCDDDNVGSIRTIEKNGGRLENVLTGPEFEKPKRRYWIVTGPDVNRDVDEPVEVAEYDTRWPSWYEADAAEISRALGSRLRGLEHFGSTSVPGLAAKPIVDVLVAPVKWPLRSEDQKSLEGLGYEYLGEAGVPGREYFRRRGQHDTNLAVVEFGGQLWRDNLLLRDYLRGHPDAASAYARQKKDVWARGAQRLLAYSAAKAAELTALLAAAKAWRA